MCAACVAQGSLYVGSAVGALRLMATRAEMKRRGRAEAGDDRSDADLPEPAVPSTR